MLSLNLFLFATCFPIVWLMDQKALDEFVKFPDPHYKYHVLQKKVIEHFYPFHFDTINMTSQKWLDETEVDKPVWSHELKIVYLKKWKIGNSCFLIIYPGQNEISDIFLYLSLNRTLMHFVINMRATIAVLKLVPIQPLTFYKHPLGHKNITGYDILAYSWWRFLNDSSAGPEWLVQFPMVKATVRAMDTITDYVMKTYRKKITTFTLTGVAMSGWATWLTAAVDQRVTGIIPVAMDFLNFTENFLHQYRAYCGWSYGLKPFYDLNITDKLQDPRFDVLALHVDPMAYNERYTNLTKFIFVLSEDKVFQPDNSHYYSDKLEGKTYFHIIPNADYLPEGQKNILLIPFIVFQYHMGYGGRFPKVSCNRTVTNTTGTIYFYASPEPNEVFCYQADTVGGTRRDFRMKIASGNSLKDSAVKWSKSKVENVKSGTYKKELGIPAKGWRAFFLKAIFSEHPYGFQLTLTSELHIIPDTFPCPDCSGDGCHGTLV